VDALRISVQLIGRATDEWGGAFSKLPVHLLASGIEHILNLRYNDTLWGHSVPTDTVQAGAAADQIRQEMNENAPVGLVWR